MGEDAGRNAYLAGFHAAQALIGERTGRDAKTHKGVHAQFARLTRNEPRLGRELRWTCPAWRLTKLPAHPVAHSADIAGAEINKRPLGDTA
jgi:hypothetical protein